MLIKSTYCEAGPAGAAGPEKGLCGLGGFSRISALIKSARKFFAARGPPGAPEANSEAEGRRDVSDKEDDAVAGGGSLTGAFMRYRESLRRYVARLVIKPEDVDDILQDTFVSIHSVNEAGEIRSPKFYLFAVARRTAYRELKRQSARIAESIDEAIEKGAEPPADEAPVDRAFEAREYFNTLADVVSDLPPQCRRVFVLRKVFGYSHKEISAAMGISISTVEKYLARAMMRCLQDHRLHGFRGAEEDAASGGAPRSRPAKFENE